MFVVGGENKRLCKRKESKMWEAFRFLKFFAIHLKLIVPILLVLVVFLSSHI